MEVVISGLTLSDGDAVDRLMKRNSRTLGFLPRKALDDYLEKGTVLGARSDNGVLAGYLLHAANPFRFRVVHLCVSDDFRNQKIARRLVDELKKTATTQKGIGLHCRRDYLAHDMWPALGFVPLNEKPSRSGTGHTLTFWYLDLAPSERLGLFRAGIADVWEHERPVGLEGLRDRFLDFVVPQSWRYVKQEEYRYFQTLKRNPIQYGGSAQREDSVRQDGHACTWERATRAVTNAGRSAAIG